MKIIEQNLIPTKTLYDGTKIPCIGMGTFGSDRFTPKEISAAVKGAIEIGYRLFDCAAVYGNEDLIGNVFHDAITNGTVKRDELFITSKVWNDMHQPDDVVSSCKKSLQDLQLEYIDTLFVHWPFRNYHAPGCDGDARNPDSKPFAVSDFMETWQQLENLVDMGMIRYIGMSNMTIPKLEAVLPLCRIQPALIEMEMHPSFQQPELFDYCLAHNILPIGFSPIGSPSRPDRDKTDGDYVDTELPQIVEIAKAHNVHPAIICLKWAVQRGQIPIPFSIHKDKYYSNLFNITHDPLTEKEMAMIKDADKNCRLIKGQVFLWENANGWEDLWDLDGVIIR